MIEDRLKEIQQALSSLRLTENLDLRLTFTVSEAMLLVRRSLLESYGEHNGDKVLKAIELALSIEATEGKLIRYAGGFYRITAIDIMLSGRDRVTQETFMRLDARLVPPPPPKQEGVTEDDT